jgi:hypothetical protein
LLGDGPAILPHYQTPFKMAKSSSARSSGGRARTTRTGGTKSTARTRGAAAQHSATQMTNDDDEDRARSMTDRDRDGTPEAFRGEENSRNGNEGYTGQPEFRGQSRESQGRYFNEGPRGNNGNNYRGQGSGYGGHSYRDNGDGGERYRQERRGNGYGEERYRQGGERSGNGYGEERYRQGGERSGNGYGEERYRQDSGRSGNGYGEERYREGAASSRTGYGAGDRYRTGGGYPGNSDGGEEGRMGYPQGRSEGYARQGSSFRSYDDNGRYSSNRGESGDRFERSQWERGAYGNGQHSGYGDQHGRSGQEEREPAMYRGQDGRNHPQPRNRSDDRQGPWSRGGYREQEERRSTGVGGDRNAGNMRYQHSDTQGWDRPGSGYERDGGAYGNTFRNGGDRYSVEEARGISDRDPRDQEEDRYENRYNTGGRSDEDRYARSQARDTDVEENEEVEDEASEA